jgi:hypothetical protein
MFGVTCLSKSILEKETSAMQKKEKEKNTHNAQSMSAKNMLKACKKT